jgi:cytochrome b subunit of formate dehydrogenase
MSGRNFSSKRERNEKIFNLLKKVFLIVLFVSGVFVSFAGGKATQVTLALQTLKSIVCQFFGALITVCIVLAAIAYAAGNVMGAEAGARAKVWATNLIIGAAIGVVLYIVAPPVLETLAGTGAGSVGGC